MAHQWQELLKSLGATDNAESFGDLAGELLAAKSETIVVPLEDLALLRLSGSDAVDFLHNLVTNDVRNLPPDRVRFAGLCSAKGRLISSMLVWRDGEDILLQLSADLGAAVLKKLSMYVLRSKVRIDDISAERRMLGVAGPRAAEMLARLGVPCPEPNSVAPCAGGQVVCLGGLRYVLALASDSAAESLQQIASSARIAGMAAWRWLEIGAGLPRIVSATQEAFVPQMVNMELPAVAGVSFHKGCYPGQEIVARTQYLGKVKRRMYRARMDAFFPTGTDIFAPETGSQHCGALAMEAPSPDGGHEYLVVAQSSAAEAGELHVGGVDGPRLTLLPLPYPME